MRDKVASHPTRAASSSRSSASAEVGARRTRRRETRRSEDAEHDLRHDPTERRRAPHSQNGPYLADVPDVAPGAPNEVVDDRERIREGDCVLLIIEDDDRERCIRAGASDYLPKPIDTVLLLDAIDVWVQ